MTQKIQEIDVKDLVLWTENPRDPVDSNSTDQEIAERAWNDDKQKWNLTKLAKEMRGHYDLSELPTVVFHGKKPIVYDGNRRMVLAKIKLGYVSISDIDVSKLPDIPMKIPCNVCSRDIAVQNIFRKHGDSGSWTPLERDIFIHKFMNEPKSAFLKLDEATGLISSNPHLNVGFVKKEIFTYEKLKELGFEFEDDILQSKHSKEDSLSILNNISSKVSAKVIDTRNNRGKVLDVLDKNIRFLIDGDASKQLMKLKLKSKPVALEAVKRQAPRTKKKRIELFDGILYLQAGQVSDLYRDIFDLYNYYHQNKENFSQYFPSLIRMSMRLLAETAASDINEKSMGSYIKKNFQKAKSNLDSDAKTTLSTQNVIEGSIEQLLHIGAHNYKAANNLEQTIAISIILGKILTITHGR